MAIRLHSHTAELRRMLREQRDQGETIGFVATMGGLHAGHQSLIEASRGDGNFTVVSVFVNPAQFGPNEDFDSYPRDHDSDFELAVEAGGDLIWYPEVEDLYPEEAQTMVQPGPLGQRLCGLSRPQFFPGICTVVLKLFNLIQPHQAYFGAKDFQQLAIIQRMAADFYLDVDVVGCPIVREDDGLAMSSRNLKLEPEDRDLALTLYRTITRAQTAFAEGERDAAKLREALVAEWPEGLELDYLDFRDPEFLEDCAHLTEDTRIFLGAWLNGVRLIDNARLTP
ncbi:pantoate--beta-alanine ligase [Sulfidibacter corallicola]|uniref:Pantothenate synthetase n=1 Tax=Sulfidibacter corallicola TaxID=2818388 RepID=A0A8A4TCR0_SULCO|nr:pantoate--beta-alanine ligase [Sulfidibacter corallicola]QTD47726.1 pantoate--beta-alanine ligase [Sulfidibacter corallicola]